MREATKPFALKTVFLTGLMALLVSPVTSAQERRLEMTGYLGGLSISHDLGAVSNIYFTATGEADNVGFGKYFGFRVAYFFTPNIGVEGNLSRGTNSYVFSVDDNDLGFVNLGDQFDAIQFNIGGSLIYQYPLDNGAVPYGAVGFGRQRNRPENEAEGFESVTGSEFHFGGGVKYFFEEQDLPWLGVRFDFRYHFVTDGLAFHGNDASPRHTEFTFGGVIRPF